MQLPHKWKVGVPGRFAGGTIVFIFSVFFATLLAFLLSLSASTYTTPTPSPPTPPIIIKKYSTFLNNSLALIVTIELGWKLTLTMHQISENTLPTLQNSLAKCWWSELFYLDMENTLQTLILFFCSYISS